MRHPLVLLPVCLLACEVAAPPVDVEDLPALEVLSPVDGADVRVEDGVVFRVRVRDGVGPVEIVNSGERVLGSAEPDADGVASIPVRFSRGEQVTWRARAGAELTPQQHLGVHAPPGSFTVRMEPEVLRHRASAWVEIGRTSVDAEGDEVDYRVTWFVGDVAVAEGFVLPEGVVLRGDALRAEVVAFDAWHDGPTVRASGQVVNTPPRVNRLSWKPPEPVSGDRVEIQLEVIDLEGDEVDVLTAWREQPVAPHYRRHEWEIFQGSFEVPEVRAPAPQGPLRVQVLADDGFDEREVQVTIGRGNEPPEIAEIQVRPAMPVTGMTLRATTVAFEPDDEAITVEHTWLVDGLPVPGVTEPVLANVQRGQEIVVEVVATDALGLSATARSEPILVRNARPPVPDIAFQPASPMPGEAIACQVTPNPDLEGDPISVTTSWIGPDGLYGAGPELAAGVTLEGETWRCEARLDDGQGGVLLWSASVTVAPPS